MIVFVLVIILSAGWSIEGQIQNVHQESEDDRWIWGYAEILTTSVKPLPVTPQDFTVIEKINTVSNQNENEDKTPSRMKEEFNPSLGLLISILEPHVGMELANVLAGNDTALNITINDLCSPYNPPVPDFSAPGRRISEVKCQEYIWNIKSEKERNRRISNCVFLKKFRDRTFVPFVEGGRSTISGEFPHMGAIGWKGINGEWQFKCGSSLISPRFVLTAAHCIRASDGDTTLADSVPKIVRLSLKNIFPFYNATWVTEEFDYNILNIISHPEYKSPRKYYDIALIELERAVEFSQLVRPSCLWGHSDINKLGAIATLTGWGVLAEGSLDISPELQAAVLDIIDSDKCAQYLQDRCNRNWCGLKDHQLCAGKLAGGVDACEGDSGGPLQVKIPLDIETAYNNNMYYVIGVTSFGVGCARPNLPGVYTRVSSFIDWIENIVWPQ